MKGDEGGAVDLLAGLGDSWDGRDPVADLGREGFALYLDAHRGVERDRSADGEVDAGDRLPELGVERPLGGVGEHEGARDEGDAERDR